MILICGTGRRGPICGRLRRRFATLPRRWRRRRYHRPPTQEASQDYKGVLRLIIDRSGAVESVSMPTGTRPAYDQTLMRAAREWKFQPAQRQGRPVKYLKVIEIHLAPSTSGTQ